MTPEVLHNLYLTGFVIMFFLCIAALMGGIFIIMEAYKVWQAVIGFSMVFVLLPLLILVTTILGTLAG